MNVKSTPLTGPIRALAQDIPGMPARTPVAWPLSRPMEDIPGLLDGGLPTATSGARFEGADAESLRALRNNAPSQPEYVRDGASGPVYLFYVRDELPDAVTAGFEALVAKTPSN